MLVMLLAAATQAPPLVTSSARATIRIVQSARASERDWRSSERRSDQLIRDERGRELRLRTIDHE